MTISATRKAAAFTVATNTQQTTKATVTDPNQWQVRPGDTGALIARELLGNAATAKDIDGFVAQLKLDNPDAFNVDALKPGAALTLPTSFALESGKSLSEWTIAGPKKLPTAYLTGQDPAKTAPVTGNNLGWGVEEKKTDVQTAQDLPAHKVGKKTYTGTQIEATPRQQKKIDKVKADIAKAYAAGDTELGTKLNKRLDQYEKAAERRNAFGGLIVAQKNYKGFKTADQEKFTKTDYVQDVLGLDAKGLKPEEIDQGIADCFWVSMLNAQLQANPMFLEENVAKNKDGTFTVTLFAGNLLGVRERKVVVDDKLPNNYNRLHATGDGPPPERVMKAMIYEKAFAQWMGGYDELAWGWSGRAGRNMTGLKSNAVFLDTVSDQKFINTVRDALDNNHPTVFVGLNAADQIKEKFDLKGKLGAKLEKAEKKEEENQQLLKETEVGVGHIDQHCWTLSGMRQQDGKWQVGLKDPHKTSQIFWWDADKVRKGFFVMAVNPGSAPVVDDAQDFEN